MSKNIVIQEGGVGKQLTVSKLKTDNSGSGSTLWVPEDEVTLTTKYISENGTYIAVNDGYYGYSQVTVSGVGSVSGYDSNGNESYVTTDEDGLIVTTPMPSTLEVTSMPQTQYINGEAINYENLECTAYYEDETTWTDDDHPEGVLVQSDLILTETTAHRGDEQSSTSDWYDGDVYSVNHLSMETTPYMRADVEVKGKWEIYGTPGPAEICVYLGSSSGFAYICAVQYVGVGTEYPFKLVHRVVDAETGEDVIAPAESNLTASEVTHDNKKMYYTSGWSTGAGTAIDPTSVNVTPLENDPLGSANKIAWTMIYGDHTGGDTMQVPVQWERPGDHKKLETSYTIHIER